MSRNYEELEVIGKGAYGTVYKAKDVENDRMVALKRVRIVNNSEEKGVPVSTLREITLLKQLDNMSHPNIVRMFDAFQTFSSTSSSNNPRDLVLTIVFEHVDQDLSMFLHKYPSPGLPEYLIKDLMYQLLSGLDYLHINRLIHRDIKPQNILITKNKEVKIADFGLARVYGFCKLITSVVVTLWYRSPELLLQCRYATMVDLWSVGAIMAEMYNRRPIFPGKGDLDQLNKILGIIGTPPKNEWPKETVLPWGNFQHLKRIDFAHLVPDMCAEGLELIKKLLVFDPEKRINCKTCLDQPYFDEVVRHSSRNNPPSKHNNQDKNNNKQQIHKDNSLSSSITSNVNLTDSLKNEPCCSKQDRPFPRKDSGISIEGVETSDCNDRRYFSRSDSGICVSPATIDSGASNDTVSTDNDCCEKNNTGFLCVETNLLIQERNDDAVPEDDLLKSPPRKMIKKDH